MQYVITYTDKDDNLIKRVTIECDDLQEAMDSVRDLEPSETYYAKVEEK